MITFFKDDDQRPEPSALVGRLVGKYGMKSCRSYTLPLFVVGHTGARLHMKPSVRKGGEFLPVDHWPGDDMVNMLVRKVAYVCDTVEEAASIVEACAAADRIHSDALKAAARDIHGVFSALA